ncbi:MAG: lipopolysaccharide heptosyltransferase II [Mariprofundaceae bacterium]
MDHKKLLILPPNWLGDVVMAQPAMRAFAEHYMAQPDYEQLLISGRPWIDDLLPFLGLGSATYCNQIPNDIDTAALFPNSFGSAWKVFRSGAKQRIGFRGQWRAPLLNRGAAPQLDMMHEHHRDYFLNLAEQSGVPVHHRNVELQVSDSDVEAGMQLMQANGLDPEKTICVAPGAQFGGAKRYPSEAYSHILKWLSEAGWQVLVLGTGAEHEIGNQCLSRVKTASWNSSGKTSLKEALQILASCRLLLCNDSGLMHVAAGMGKPVVGIFGATDPERTAPSGLNVRLLYRPAVCSPCLKRECSTPGQPCMGNILPETVRDSCLEMLSA